MCFNSRCPPPWFAILKYVGHFENSIFNNNFATNCDLDKYNFWKDKTLFNCYLRNLFIGKYKWKCVCYFKNGQRNDLMNQSHSCFYCILNISNFSIMLQTGHLNKCKAFKAPFWGHFHIKVNKILQIMYTVIYHIYAKQEKDKLNGY